MGDTGSMALGATLGVIAFLTNTVAVLPIIGFIFLLEALSVMIQIASKKLFKRKVFLSAPIHHHLEALGWPEPKVVMRWSGNLKFQEGYKVNKRKIITSALAIIFVLAISFFVFRGSIFKADTGPYVLSGRIFAEDSKAPLSDVNIILTSTDTNIPPITAKSNLDGSYSISASANTFTSISFLKDGYWDLTGSVINSGNLSNMNLSLAMKSGFGQEDIEIATVKKGRPWETTRFGLSIQPTDNSPSGLKTIVPDGSTYQEQSLGTSSFEGYDLVKHGFAPMQSTVLFAGETLKVGSSKDLTILFRGKAKTDNFSFLNKKIDEGNWQNSPPTYFANPYLKEIPLSSIAIRYQDKDYSVKDAVSANIINSTIFISNYPNQKQLDFNNPDLPIPTGAYFAFWSKKDGVSIAISSNTNNNTVELPTDISYDEFVQIAQHDQILPADQQADLENKENYIIANTYAQMAKNNISITADMDILLTKNEKVINPNQLNSHYMDLLQQQSNKGINIAHADTNTKASIDFLINRASFGADIATYNQVNDFKNTQLNNIKAIMGEPIFSRTVKVYNLDKVLVCNSLPSYAFGDLSKGAIFTTKSECLEYMNSFKDNGASISNLNVIIIDFNGQSISKSREETLEHEMSHSWRSVFKMVYSHSFEEGLAESLPFVMKQVYNPNYSAVGDKETPVNNFDYWANNVPEAYRTYTGDKYLGYYYDGYDFLSEYGIQDDFFWTRKMHASAILKFFIQDYEPGSPTFYQKFDDNLFLEVVKNMGYPVNLQMSDQYQINMYNLVWKNGKLMSDMDLYNIFSNSGNNEDLKQVENIDLAQWFKTKSVFHLSGIYNTPAVVASAVIQYPEAQTICTNNDLKCLAYQNKSMIFYTNSFQSNGGRGVSYLTGTFNNKIYYFTPEGNALRIVDSTDTTDEQGALDITPTISLAKTVNSQYTGSWHFVSVAKEDNGHGSRGIYAGNLFTKAGSGVGSGIYGTADLPDGTVITLNHVKDDGSLEQVAQTTISNYAYEFPQVNDNYGQYVLNTTGYTKNIDKWKGHYEQDIKTDTTNPIITSKGSSGSKINYSLSEPASAFIEYGLEKDKYDNISFGKAIDASKFEGDEIKDGDRELTIENLDKTKEYHYRIWAIDKSGNISHTDDQVLNPIDISNIQIKDITDTSATITWTADPATQAVIEYGTTTNYGQTKADTEVKTNHSVNLTGLTKGTTYHFRIKAFITDANKSNYSSDQTFQAITFAISNITTGYGTGNLPKITWNTSVSAFGLVEYGETASYGSTLASGNPTFKETTKIALFPNNLPVGKTYHFRIKAYVSETAPIYSSDQTITYNPCSEIRNAWVGETGAQIYMPYSDKTLTISGQTYPYQTGGYIVLSGLTPATH
ncbi:MAG: phospho-N-acetylmuramoyl-pentapeptide-transferase [Berkelbacteria bacterium GW2011_GWB1_38_5]|uniref:Phospho-N-acetylmuramoyl-pentapeptide-transferase n=1 Tax=Berkelbacteria bacterium GW2011_GWB1_38_5 TaxID=1618336 RepID=A0A0G0N6Z1_9BACT|nr:MAG: phospho-N-acetylmuramoyl-pentapeptide-transferase [Berkelbacteria bacterium GW2011_GWB1_38_5]